MNKKYVIYDNNKKCKWHEGDEPLEEDEYLYCPNCGNILETRICEGCGKEFLDYESDNWDDIVGAPRVTSAGDLCCAACYESCEPDFRENEDTYELSGYDKVDNYNLIELED